MTTTLCPERLYEYKRSKGQETIQRMKSPTGVIVEGHLLRLLQEQGYDLNPKRDNKSEYDPDSLFVALDRYTVKELSFDQSILAQAIDLSFRTFGLSDGDDALSPLKSPEMLLRAIKGEKASGAPHFTKKEEVFGKDFDRSVRIIRDGASMPPCIAFHRVQHGLDGPKTRLVWGYPLSMTLCEARFARPLIDKFLKARTPMAFGLAKHQLAARTLELQQSGVVYGIDFSKFDASANERLIRAAFSILSTHFCEDDLDNWGWEKIVRYFIHTTIIMPDGHVWKKHTGVPSGSYFTQLVGSIINFTVIQYMAIRTTGRCLPSRKVNVLGDDSLFSVPGWFDVKSFANHAAEVGFTVNVSKSGRWRSNESPTFLGHSWELGIPDRPSREIAIRIAFPETPSQRSTSLAEHRQRKIERLIAFCGDAKCAWEIVYKTGLLGKNRNLPLMFSFHKRSRYPVTGMEEYQHILGMEVLAAQKTMYHGLLR